MTNDRRGMMGVTASGLLDAYGSPVRYRNMATGSNTASRVTGNGSSMFSGTQGGNVKNVQSDIYNPLFEPTSVILPTRSREINQWARHFYRSDGMVRASIDLHSEFPVTGFQNVLDDDEGVRKFYDELAFDILHLDELVFDMSLEWWKLGNIFMFQHWNESEAIYDEITLLNPDYVDVTKSPFSKDPHLMMQVDDTLKNIVTTRQPPEVYAQIPEEIKAAVAAGKKIALNPYVISVTDPNTGNDIDYKIPVGRHMAMKAAHYETIGTPLLYSVFKVLFYKDLIRRAQVAIAKRHITPIKVVKVGSPDAEPSQEHIDAIRDILSQIENNPHNYLVTHHAIAIDYIAGAGHIMNLTPEYEWIDKELLSGLLMSKSSLYGEGPTYGAQTVAIQMLLNRYLRFERMLSNLIEECIYKPIAVARGFWRKDPVTKRHKLMYPKIQWEMMRMRDDVAQKNLMATLLDKSIISKRTFYHTLGLDYDSEKRAIAKERAEAPPPAAGMPGAPGGMPGGAPMPGAPMPPPGGMGVTPPGPPGPLSPGGAPTIPGQPTAP